MRRASKNWEYFFLKVNICGTCLSPSVSKSILLVWYFKSKHWLQNTVQMLEILCAGEVGVWLWALLFYRQTHPESVASIQLVVPATRIQITNKHGRKCVGRDSLTLSDSSRTHYFNNEHSPSMIGTRLNFYVNILISSGTTLPLKIKLTISNKRHNTFAHTKKGRTCFLLSSWEG